MVIMELPFAIAIRLADETLYQQTAQSKWFMLE